MFCASFYNNTKFQIQNVRVKFFCSQNLKLALKQRNFCNISEISTGEVFEWKVRAVICSPGEISGNFWFEFNGEELPETCSYGSLVYTVPIPDILLRDISSGRLFSKFVLLWVRLSYGITVRCELVKGFEEMIEEVQKHMEKIPCGKDLKVGFQGVTLQGDRIALYVTGSIGSKNVRIEYRTNSVDLLKNFTNQTEVFIAQLSNGMLKLVS